MKAISYCPTKEMVSDFLSKPLHTKIMEMVRDQYIDGIIDKKVSHEKIMGIVSLIIVLEEKWKQNKEEVYLIMLNQK